MMNVQQMLYGNAGKGGDRVDNGLKIETVKKIRRKGAIQHGTFYIGCVTCGAHLLARATK
jgi:hypothetical protein